MQLIEGEPVTVLAQVGHRQPAGQLHAAAVVMPAVVVLVPGALPVGGVVVLVVRTGQVSGAPRAETVARCLSPLGREILQHGHSIVERCGDLVFVPDVEPRARCGHRCPHIVDDGPELGPGLADDDEDISVGRCHCISPVAATDLVLDARPKSIGADAADDQDVGPPGGDAEERVPQVHRSAPSRQA